MTPKKLDIGGTLHTLMCVRGNPADDYDRQLAATWQEFWNVDLYHHNDKTIRASIFNIPVPDNSVEYVYSSHTIEHVEQWQVPQLLAEWYRILEPGGKFWLSSPSLRHMLQGYLDSNEDSTTKPFFHNMIFANHLDEGDHHLAAFTVPQMQQYLEDVGFVIDEIKYYYPCHGQEEVRVRAHK